MSPSATRSFTGGAGRKRASYGFSCDTMNWTMMGEPSRGSGRTVYLPMPIATVP
jgi:hypothetical protein